MVRGTGVGRGAGGPLVDRAAGLLCTGALGLNLPCACGSALFRTGAGGFVLARGAGLGRGTGLGAMMRYRYLPILVRVWSTRSY